MTTAHMFCLLHQRGGVDMVIDCKPSTPGSSPVKSRGIKHFLVSSEHTKSPLDVLHTWKKRNNIIVET